MKKNLLHVSIFGSAIVMALSGITATQAQNIAPYWSTSGNNNGSNTTKLGTTNVAPLRFITNNAERIYIDASGKVGIGTSLPLNILTVKLNGSAPASSWLAGSGSLPAFLAFGENMTTGFNLATAADPSGYRPVLNTRRSRGTLAAPTAVQVNDYLASFVSSGFDGSTFQNPATIDFYVDGAPSAGMVPGRISFVTGSNAANRVERLKVGSTGNFNFNNAQLTIVQATGYIGIGTNNPSSRLHVDGSGRFGKGVAVDSGGLVAAAGNTFGTGVSGTGYYGVSGTGAYGVAGYGDVGLYGVGGPTGVIGIGNRYGVFGDGKEYGLYGSSNNGIGAYAISNLASGVGIKGEATGITAIGVYGVGGVTGVKGFSNRNGGAGVSGEATIGTGVSGTGGIFGVSGFTDLSAGTGVIGQATATNGTGVRGIGATGVKGISFLVGGNGVRGESTGINSAGVVGISTTNVGVYGEGRIGLNGYTSQPDGRAVNGVANSRIGIGVYGYSQYYTGVYGSTAVPSSILSISYGGFFSGDVGTTGSYWTGSDRKLKQRIDGIAGAMDIIKKLQPKSYYYKHDGDYKLMNLPAGIHYGLIAQDLELVLPNLVRNTKFETHMAIPETKEGEGDSLQKDANRPTPATIEYKTVNYTQLIPIVIKGMQEQELKIENLESKVAEVDALKREIADLRQVILELKKGTIGTNAVAVTGAYLMQNTPNPFSGTTTINYSVPDNMHSVKIIITNAKGQLIKTITPQNTGSGKITLNTAILAAGSYNYSLWVQGRQVDSKSMIIAR